MKIYQLTDLCAEPHPCADDFSQDFNRLSQLLPGEEVNVIEEQGEWLLVDALLQPVYKERWRPYRGWIHRSELEQTPPPPESRIRLGLPYLWGGMDTSRGIDCSALLHLSYRKAGAVIPRDAADQFHFSEPVDPNETQPGDWIFLEKEGKVYHVLVAIDQEKMLEASGYEQAGKVQLISYKEKLGKSLAELATSPQAGEDRVSFRRVALSS